MVNDKEGLIMMIKEAARITGVSADTLRYYERIGLIPAVPRTKSGIRDYTDYYIQWIGFLQELKSMGMSLESMIDYIELAKRGDSTYEERKRILADARMALLRKIQLLQDLARRADYQLANYEQTLLPETESLISQLTA
jgi:DNA-binding transcriptional MerR regulator